MSTTQCFRLPKSAAAYDAFKFQVFMILLDEEWVTETSCRQREKERERKKERGKTLFGENNSRLYSLIYIKLRY